MDSLSASAALPAMKKDEGFEAPDPTVDEWLESEDGKVRQLLSGKRSE